MATDDKFLGVPYPITTHARGLLRTQKGINQIKSDLLAMLLTSQGERVMLPSYGCNLRKFLFEPNDSVLVAEVRNLIDTQLRLWEPRVVISDIEITTQIERNDLNISETYEEIDSILLIRIRFFDPENIREIQELKLDIPLAGS